MIAVLRGICIGGMILALLIGCSSSEDEYNKNQKYYFLESLRQVETGGRQLQSAELDEASITEALATLDQGLKLAFQVERRFLDALDLRLGKNYQRYFVEGVENYRLGIEAGDKAQQVKGLELLQHWAVFWNAEQATIREKLQPE